MLLIMISVSRIIRGDLCINLSISLGPLQKFERAAEDFKGALGFCIQLILSPVFSYIRSTELLSRLASGHSHSILYNQE